MNEVMTPADTFNKLEEVIIKTQNAIKEKHPDIFEPGFIFSEIDENLLDEIKNTIHSNYQLKHLTKENSLFMINDVLVSMKDITNFITDAIEGSIEILSYMDLFLIVFKKAINIMDLSNDNYTLEFDFIQKDDLMLLMRYVQPDEFLMATDGRIIIKVNGDVIGKLLNAYLNSNNI